MKTPSLHFETLLPIRALDLERTQPDKFSRLMSLESHAEDLMKTDRWPLIEERVVEPLSKLFERSKVAEICGIISTNSFEIGDGKGNSIFGVYDLASMMNHDCVGNVRIAIDSKKTLSAFASVDIAKNEAILFNYGRALDSFEERRKQLKEFKFFECECSRCKDPTDFGTFVGALKCYKCSTGAVVRVRDNKVKWKCLSCDKFPSSNEVQRAFGALRTAKARNCKSEKDLRGNLADVRNHLFANHGFIIEMKMLLARALRPDLAQNAERIWREKLELSEAALDVLNVLEPGLSLNRGLLLHEAQAAVVQLANIEFERDTTKTKALKAALAKARKMLSETKLCLEPEASDSFESKQRRETIRQEEEELDNYIEMVKEL